MAATTAAADSPTLGSRSQSPDRKRPKPSAVNFSRPRIYKTSSGRTYTEGDENVKSVNAYYDEGIDDEDEGSFHRGRDSGNPMPSEPRFSLDDEDEALPREARLSPSPPLPSEARFSVETFELDGTGTQGKTGLLSRTEAFLKRKGSALLRTEDQRHPGVVNRNNSTSNDSSSTRPETSDTSTSVPESLRKIMPMKSILKQTSVEVHSEYGGDGGQEDTASHHTVSESGSGTYDQYGKWHASDFDTSGLSEKELKKLEKKGVNPALYAEMKAARGGKSYVGALTGNTYVS